MAASTRRAKKPVLVERSIDGLSVRITYKRIKNLHVRIARDGSGVEVSAPLYMSEREILAFVQSKRSWIDQKLQQVESSSSQTAANATPEQVAEYRAVVEACAPALVKAWEPIMGVKAGKLAYRNMTSRWGSCQPATGRICLNIRLALYPPECL